MKSLNWNRILRQILPSVFFIVLFALGTFGSKFLSVNLIAGFILLLLLGNIFLQNKIASRFFGVIFLLCSFYMTLALFDDIADGEATLGSGYWVGLLLIIISIAMSVLLILAYEKKKTLSESERG
jgi:hypothetical protein